MCVRVCVCLCVCVFVCVGLSVCVWVCDEGDLRVAFARHTGHRHVAAVVGAATRENVPRATWTVPPNGSVVVSLAARGWGMGHAACLAPRHVVVGVRAHAHGAVAVGVNAHGLPIVLDRTISREDSWRVPFAVCVDARPIFPNGTVFGHGVAPHPRRRVLHRRAIEHAVLGIPVHAFVAVCFVILIKAMIQTIDVFVVNDAVRIVVPPLWGRQMINRVVWVVGSAGHTQSKSNGAGKRDQQV